MFPSDCHWPQALSVLAALALGGCARYQAAPITQSDVDAKLAAPAQNDLNVEISRLDHPLLKPTLIDLDKGLTPRQAAIVAVVMNPSLRAIRDQRAAADAQLIQAGILPNPQLTYDYLHPIGGGVLAGTTDSFGVGLSWDIQELISRDAHIASARANVKSVCLDIAWQEWQIAEAAEQAAVDLLVLQDERAIDEEIDRRLADNRDVIRKAVDAHQKTLLDLAAAESAGNDAHTAVLQAKKDELDARFALNRSLGLAAQTIVRIRADDESIPPAAFTPPPLAELLSGLEDRRLDLLALKRGYQSEEETLRAAVLEQFPKINLGFNRGTDTTDVHSIGFGVTVDIPVFDRNQGVIATERATRKRLYDEYVQRVFEARSDIATSLADINAITAQIADAQAAVPGLEQLARTYQDAMDHGNTDVLSYYTAQVDVAQKSIDILKLRQQLADNRIALQIAAGRFLPDASASATQPTSEGGW